MYKDEVRYPWRRLRRLWCVYRGGMIGRDEFRGEVRRILDFWRGSPRRWAI